MSDILGRLAADRVAGWPTGLTAVCSAHPLVLEAALRHGAACAAPVLIEATCNQVNQDGGYTGMTPATFRQRVEDLARGCGLAAESLVLGGDHLGPNPWTKLPAEAAMRQAEVMVAAYVAAGFAKLHLDTSMSCADDPAILPEATVAARAARLAGAAERAAEQHGCPSPVYVVGTEVPPPGGARERIDSVPPTDPARAEATIAAHETAFATDGLEGAMRRVIGIVVQPGVEFGVDNVVDYRPEAAEALSRVLDAHPGLVFEAHSTDYQSASALTALARDGFAIRKVGPWLTFALRETLYGLDALAAEIVNDGAPRLPAVMEQLMLARPQHWQGHYHGDAAYQRLMRHASYSDRIRYYWAAPEAEQAVTGLLARLADRTVPETLVSQFLPAFYERVREGRMAARPRDFLLAAVTDVLLKYDDRLPPGSA